MVSKMFFRRLGQEITAGIGPWHTDDATLQILGDSVMKLFFHNHKEWLDGLVLDAAGIRTALVSNIQAGQASEAMGVISQEVFMRFAATIDMMRKQFKMDPDVFLKSIK